MAARQAIVVGAGQGMGKAIALKLASQGIYVYLVGRTKSKLDTVAAAIQAAGGSAAVFPADVTIEGALDSLISQLSGLDILVSCAGEALLKTFDETTFADWHRILSVNLDTAYLTTHALLPLLRKSDNASIILLSSKVALKGYPVVAYTAAKTGLMGFARSLSFSLRQEHIRVVALCPGPADTPMRWEATPGMDRNLTISPESIAETVSLLVNLPRGTTTGEILIQSDLYD